MSRKVAGLTMAGAATATAAIAVIGAGTSTSPTRSVSQNRHYTAPPAARTAAGGMDADQAGRMSRTRHRPLTVTLTSHYAVAPWRWRTGRAVPVRRKAGRAWRTVGWLRAHDRHVPGTTVRARRTVTVIVVLSHRRFIRLVVPPRSVIVVADNGRIGVVPARYLVVAPRPTTTPTPAHTPTAPMTTSPMTPPGPAPTGSQAPVVGGLKDRVSPKW